jgi:hypothetical protein
VCFKLEIGEILIERITQRQACIGPSDQYLNQLVMLRLESQSDAPRPSPRTTGGPLAKISHHLKMLAAANSCGKKTGVGVIIGPWLDVLVSMRRFVSRNIWIPVVWLSQFNANLRHYLHSACSNASFDSTSCCCSCPRLLRLRCRSLGQNEVPDLPPLPAPFYSSLSKLIEALSSVTFVTSNALFYQRD